MKRLWASLLMGLMLISLPIVSGATDYSWQPNPKDLYDLDHGKYYKWGIDWAAPEGEYVAGASLFFDDIRNWKTETNDLWVHLLDTLQAGVKAGSDNDNLDQFSGQGVLLNHWHNLPATAQDITYVFDDAELAYLNTYLADANFGFGFDPDCHFYNKGITFSLQTAPIPNPEPATMLLIGSGLLGLGGLRKRLMKK